METVKVIKVKKSAVKDGKNVKYVFFKAVVKKEGKEDKVINLTFSNECKVKLEREMIKQSIDFPVLISFEDVHYFITEENEYDKLVITDFVSIAQGENDFEKSKRTLASLFDRDLFN